MPLSSFAVLALAATATVNAQSNAQNLANTFRVVGNSGVSAQQMFLSTTEKVVVIDKTEGNGNNLNIGGHPAFGTEYNLRNNSARAMELVSNTFCAGGNSLGDGRWLNVGGNQAVGPGGLPGFQYGAGDGGRSMRVFEPCGNGQCDWEEVGQMSTRRWYPTLETLEDGSMIIIGGCDWGGYVNDANQNNPTYEFYPSQGSPRGLNLLLSTLPANLYPLTWLLPSGRLFINANLGNEIFDYKNAVEYPLPATPHAVRTYPGSAATGMMPLTPANNYTATIWMCGGADLQPDQWVLTYNIAGLAADRSCISITPDESPQWKDEQSLPEGRSMGSMINLPDGRFVILEGVGRGTAGYGNQTWAVGQSYGDAPVMAPLYLDPSAPEGSKLYRDGMANATVPRLYHSTALLLPDGSVFTAGSNPNADFVGNNTRNNPYPTEYRTEIFYPDYYDRTRPEPTGLPERLTYGGSFFNVTLSAQDVPDASLLTDAKVMVLRAGFATHAINFGMRTVQLEHTATRNADGSTTLFVSQVPTPAILAPGPAMIFVVIDGVPSIGEMVMVGNGRIGEQNVSPRATLPPNAGWIGNFGSSSQAVVGATQSAAVASPSAGAASQPAASASSSGIFRPRPSASVVADAQLAVSSATKHGVSATLALLFGFLFML